MPMITLSSELILCHPILVNSAYAVAILLPPANQSQNCPTE
jgi:hypothetical protein